MQAFAPLRGCGWRGELLPVVLEPFQQLAERAEQGGVETADLGVGGDAVQRVAVAHGIAEQHAAQAEAPAVLFQRGQLQAVFLRAVQAPADAGAFDPAAQQGLAGIVEAEALAQCGYVEQVQHVADGEACVGQRQQVFQRHDQRYPATRGLVGHAAGQVARIARRHAAEHRLDVRAVGLDVGHHDDHVARRQRPAVARGLLEHGQQLVVQDLHFALRVVGDVEAQRVVVVAPRFALGGVGR